MLRKTLAGAIAIALIAAPVGTFAAAGDPGAGIEGSNSPATQPTAPKQSNRMGGTMTIKKNAAPAR
jgi:hypothetical protein